MAVKRKSNWYIYFIAFGITLAFVIGVIFTFSWFLFPEIKETSGLTSAGELADDFRPDPTYNFTLVASLADKESDIPELFTMISYDAVENRVVFIPLPNGISVPADERTLPNIFASKGGEGVIAALTNAVGITCDGYIHFDRSSFVDFVSAFGNVRYDIPKTVLVEDGVEIAAFNAGEQLFSPESTFRYVYLADFSEGEEYRFNILGDVFACLFNQNYRYADSALVDSYFKVIYDNCSTDITEEAYFAKKAALLNTIMYGSEPAEYYVPYGEYGEDGSFSIAETSITTIKQKCGQYE